MKWVSSDSLVMGNTSSKCTPSGLSSGCKDSNLHFFDSIVVEPV